MEKLIIIFIILASAPSILDFTIWFGVFVENDKHPKQWLFRVCKAIFDFGILPFVAVYFFDVSYGLLAAFYIAKWWHLCDSLYNIYRYILTNKPTEEWGYWRWWTPLGLLRTNWWGICAIKGHTERDFQPKQKVNKSKFSKGMVSIQESWYQTAIGLFLAAVIALIWA